MGCNSSKTAVMISKLDIISWCVDINLTGFEFNMGRKSKIGTEVGIPVKTVIGAKLFRCWNFALFSAFRNKESSLGQ